MLPGDSLPKVNYSKNLNKREGEGWEEDIQDRKGQPSVSFMANILQNEETEWGVLCGTVNVQ